MVSLIERAALVLSRQSVAALPLAELVRLLAESGAPASRSVLLRALVAEPERFRVLKPLGVLARAESGVGGARGTPGRGVVADERACWRGPVRDAEEVWVLSGPRAASRTAEERAVLRRLRATLVGLGWAVDATSARDLSRWAGMVLEGERLRRALSPDQRAPAPS